jgi:acetolactate decarboxylase
MDNSGRRDPVEVRSFGELRKIMHEGQVGPTASIQGAIAEPHAFAVGALSGLRGEVTVLDGAIWLAYPDGNRARVERVPQTAEQATLFVVAHVPEWVPRPIHAEVQFEQLDQFIEDQAKEAGLDVGRPFPVRIEGPIAGAQWHVVGGAPPGGSDASHDHLQNAVKGSLEDVDAQLVGFFAQSAQGVFTHMGKRTHFHVVQADTRTMGHVDRVTVKPGARILLP